MQQLLGSPGEQLDLFGYYVWKGLLDPTTVLAPIIDEYDRLLDDVCRRWHAKGFIAEAFDGLPFSERLCRVLNETDGNIFQELDISLPGQRTTPDTPIHLGRAVFNLLTNPDLLDAVEGFIGANILIHPVQHVRIKPREADLKPDLIGNTMIAQTAWHQDQSVILEDADETNVLTVWIPVTEASIENGCIVLAPGGHSNGLDLHCLKSPTRSGLHLHDDRVPDDSIPVPMVPGDVLFMHRMTPHAALPNRSDGVRWSFDLRFSPIGMPTGRSWAPSFEVRRSSQDRELTYEEWRRDWLNARATISSTSPTSFRWPDDDPRCA